MAVRSRWGSPARYLQFLWLPLGVASALDITQHYDAAPFLPFVVATIELALIAVARRFPWPTLAIAMAGACTLPIWLHPVSAAEPWPWTATTSAAALAVVVQCARALRDPRASMLMLGGVVLASGAPFLYDDRGSWISSASFVVVTGLALLAIHAYSQRDDAAESSTVLQERSRMARELHDVVAHHMSIVAVQAESAPRRLRDVSPEVAAEFASIASTARRALIDLRQSLSALRTDGPADLAPQSTLAEVDELVENARRAGVEASWGLIGSFENVPTAVSVSAYRIVQECLSNAVRHAPGSTATVLVDAHPDHLEIRVENSSARRSRPFGSPRYGGSPGYGQRGIRERVELLGGTCGFSSTPDGGYLATVTIPLHEVVR